MKQSVFSNTTIVKKMQKNITVRNIYNLHNSAEATYYKQFLSQAIKS